MAIVDSAPSSSSSRFNLSTHKDSAVLLLTFFVPPAAIVVGQGKVDLESRHLALSLALYFSFIFYIPAVLHAYWLLYVRDNGGVEEYARARLRQAQGLWNEHGGIVKTKVDEYSPKVIEKYEAARTYTTDKVNYVTGKKDEAVALVKDTIAAVHKLFEDAKEAYAAGIFIDWAKEKMHIVLEKVKTLLESYPRLQALVRYAEQRASPVFEHLLKIYETIRAKLYRARVDEVIEMEDPGRDDSTRTRGDIPAATPRPQEILSDDHEVTDSTVEAPKSNGTSRIPTAAQRHQKPTDENKGGDGVGKGSNGGGKGGKGGRKGGNAGNKNKN